MIRVSRQNDKTVYAGPGDARTRVLIDGAEGAGNVSVGFMRFPVGGRTDTHVRDVEEVIYIIKGKSAIVAGDERYELDAGDAIFIPPDNEHYHENIGDGVMEHLFIFSPQGPEETIKKLPEI